MSKRGDSANYALDSAQVKRLMDSCADTEERTIIGCMVYLGLRISEVAHMRADWLKGDGMLHIPFRQLCNCNECQHTAGEPGIWHPKTKAGARVLPIPSLLRGDIEHLLHTQADGLQLSRVTLWGRSKTIMKRAGIQVKGLSGNTAYPHALRATCATMLAANGMSAVALAYYMGWKSIVLGDHYVRLAEAKEIAIKQAQRIFG